MAFSALLAGGGACRAAADFSGISRAHASAAPAACARPTASPGAADTVALGEQTIRWIRGPESDRVHLDRWCAGVGSAVVQGPADSLRVRMANASGPATLDELAVVSWNTHVGGGDLPALLDDLRAGRLTGGDSVRHFVLLLQEVYRAGGAVPRGGEALRPRRIAPRPRRGDRRDIVEVARAQGLHLFYVPSMANGWDAHDALAEDRGNAIVSTLPLSGHTAIELPFEGQRRVAVSATIQATEADGRGTSLRVVSVHLDNRSGLRRALRSFGSGRARQAEALATALTNDGASSLPTVLAGDLNTWAPPQWERAVAVLRAHFPLGNPVLEPTFAGPPLGVGRSLDHMMFHLPMIGRERRIQPPARTVRLRDTHGSDHHPLLTRLSLSNDA